MGGLSNPPRDYSFRIRVHIWSGSSLCHPAPAAEARTREHGCSPENFNNRRDPWGPSRTRWGRYSAGKIGKPRKRLTFRTISQTINPRVIVFREKLDLFTFLERGNPFPPINLQRNIVCKFLFQKPGLLQNNPTFPGKFPAAVRGLFPPRPPPLHQK